MSISIEELINELHLQNRFLLSFIQLKRVYDQITALLHDEIQQAAQAIRHMTPAERSKKGIHLSRGEMTVADIIESFVVAHAEDHLGQVRAALRG